MATDVDVQFFSHLNGLTLGNNWGDLIRSLDKALATGIDFTEITSASINEQGDVIIDLYAAHNAMLFQIVELSGFSPASINQKYRIKGVPSATQLILKPKIDIAERAVTTRGTGKLASLGYEIVFRDANDVKRVYRAKNPTSQHPFIRVDESLASDSGSYTSTYAKYAMVGLLEHMDHIDDYENPTIQQLPFDPNNPSKNWRITGTGTGCVRGWSRWYYSRSIPLENGALTADSSGGNAAAKRFTLCGDSDCFYFLTSTSSSVGTKRLYGCGLFNPSIDTSDATPWFLMSPLLSVTAGAGYYEDYMEGVGCTPLFKDANTSKYITVKHNPLNQVSAHVVLTPIIPNFLSGQQNYYGSAMISALEIPHGDSDNYLRGTLKIVNFCGNARGATLQTTPLLGGVSMYVFDSAYTIAGSTKTTGGLYFYLGELE